RQATEASAARASDAAFGAAGRGAVGAQAGRPRPARRGAGGHWSALAAGARRRARTLLSRAGVARTKRVRAGARRLSEGAVGPFSVGGGRLLRVAVPLEPRAHARRRRAPAEPRAPFVAARSRSGVARGLYCSRA